MMIRYPEHDYDTRSVVTQQLSIKHEYNYVRLYVSRYVYIEMF